MAVHLSHSLPGSMAHGRAPSRLLQLMLLVVLLCPSVAFGQVVISDSAASARAERLFWQAESLIHSTDRAELLQAVALWREAVALYEVGHHPGRVAGMLGKIAGVYYRFGDLDSSLVYFTRALSLSREARDARGEAQSLHFIGMAHDDMGHPDTALAYYARALQIRRAEGDKEGEASTLGNMGVVHGQLGRADSALAYHARALEIQHAQGDREGQAATLGNMGVVHAGLGRPDSASANFARALILQRDMGDRSGEATSLGNIGGVQERPDSALVYYALALQIWQSLGDHTGEAATLTSIGVAHGTLGQMDSALVYFARALPLQRDVSDRSGEANTLHNIGAAQRSLGRPDSALVYYALSLPIRREVGNRSGEAITLDNIGEVFLSSAADGSAKSAAAAFDSSAALRAGMRRRAGGDANAVSFSELGGLTFASWSYAWQLLARQASTAGDSVGLTRALASSLAAAERGRAQALRDLLDRRPGAIAAGLDASDTIPGADLAAEAGRLLTPLRATNVALLYYLSVGDAVLAWFLDPSGALRVLAPIVLPIGELAQHIATARGALGADAAAARQRRGDPPMAQPNRVSRDGLGGSAGDPAAAVAALQALSAGVLPTGLEMLLPPGTELVIVPHGALGQVPFAALTLPGDTIPLGVRNPLRYAPSLRALVAAEASGENTPSTGAGKARGPAIVVGNPQMPEVRDETGNLHQLRALPGAAEEGRWVATKLGTQVLTGSAASESAVRSSLSNAWVVHLATHGLAYGTEARVRDSYVALAPGAGQDGLLTLGELLDDDSLRLTADLIVLSACQTGLGESREAEGTVGLQRGLLAKGARSVLVSLWSVDDDATHLLMERFYTHWLDQGGRPALSKAEALRLAQSDLRAKEQFSNPLYWAAFQLVGAR